MSPSSLLLLLCTVMLIAALAMLALTMRKLRLVHLATYKLLDDGETVRTESTALFGQLQALMALERTLGMPEALPPMRGWAGSPDFLLQVAEAIRRRRPRVIVECSSGVSTIVSARCLQQLGAGHVYSLEHEPAYAQKTRALLARHGLSDWATVIDAPLVTRHTSTPWYDEDKLPHDLGPIEMLVVDGPPKAVGRLARAPALPRLMHRMAPACIVMADDADRPDEIEMVRQWRALDPTFVESRPFCEKGLAVLERGG